MKKTQCVIFTASRSFNYVLVCPSIFFLNASPITSAITNIFQRRGRLGLNVYSYFGKVKERLFTVIRRG